MVTSLIIVISGVANSQTHRFFLFNAEEACPHCGGPSVGRDTAGATEGSPENGELLVTIIRPAGGSCIQGLHEI